MQLQQLSLRKYCLLGLFSEICGDSFGDDGDGKLQNHDIGWFALGDEAS